VLRSRDSNYGLIQSAGHENGVFIYQATAINVGGEVFPTLEFLAASRVLGEDALLPEREYLINFIGGLERLPKINIKRVLSGGLISELLDNKTVLIGVKGMEPIAEFYTPISKEEGLVSDLMLRGFALDTLLSNRQIKVVHPGLSFLFFLLIIAGSLFFSQWLSFQASFYASIGISLVYIGFCWVVLIFLYILLPYTELFLAQWIAFFAVWRFQMISEDQALESMLLGLSVKLQEKSFPVSFYNTEDPWAELITMVNQTLNLHRIIFLERVEGDHRLREIKALNCSIDDISEMRRDYERTPYSTAISEHKVLFLNQPFLNKVPRQEDQYLAPLIFAGDVLGFWAFTIEPKNRHSKVKFDSLTHDFMQEISEVLHYRQEWHRKIAHEQSRVWRYLRIEGGGTSSYKSLNKSVVLMEKRISIMHEVFDNLSSSGILYDLFGHVLLVNNKMEKLARTLEILPYNMTMLDFVAKVTGYDENKVRDLLQQTVFDHEVISISVAPIKSNRSYMLFIRPLKVSEKELYEEKVIEETNVFAMRGVLCELVDISELKQLWALEGQVPERVGGQVNKALASTLSTVSQLNDDNLSSESKKKILTVVQAEINEILKGLEGVNQQANSEVEYLANNKLDCYPVDGVKAFELAVDEVQEEVSKLGAIMHISIPQMLSLVLASPYELTPIFRVVLLALLDDSGRQGNIWVEVQEKNGQALFLMYNDGAGVPQEDLEQFFDSSTIQSSDLAKIHDARRGVVQWGGELNINSEVGKGLRIELILRTFFS